MAYLLELLDSTLVNTTALVDQVTGSGRLAGIDVADNDDVDMCLLLTEEQPWSAMMYATARWLKSTGSSEQR